MYTAFLKRERVREFCNYKDPNNLHYDQKIIGMKGPVLCLLSVNYVC